MNKRSIEILNGFINNNEDYEKVILSEEQHRELENRCSCIPILDEDWIWDETEVVFHQYIINLGYNQNPNTFQWEITNL